MGTKDDRIGIRIAAEIKISLQAVAKKEGRSLAQICEILLKGGVLEYEREGPAYLRRILNRAKEKGK